jgi:hypothetical protein
VAEVRDSAKAAPVVIRLRSTTQTAPAANSFAESANSHTVQILLSSLRSKMTAAVHTDRVHPQQTEPSASDGQNDGETAMTDKQRRQTMEEPPDMVSVDGELIVREEWGDSTQEPYAPEIFRTETVFEKEPLECLAAKGELMSYTHKGFWQCMDTKREMDMLEKMLKKGTAPWKVWTD